MEIRLIIPYEPTAKARARTFVRNGRTMTFTPKKTTDAEAFIRTMVLQNGITPISDKTIPLKVDMTFYINRPASKKKSQIIPVTRPDTDNYIKTVCDGMNGYVMPDDSQISHLVAKKRYGSPPRIEIIITEDRE